MTLQVAEFEFTDSLTLEADGIQTELLQLSTGDFDREIIRDHNMIRLESLGTSGSERIDDGTTHGLDARLKSPLIRLPSGTLPKQKVKVLQQWEGVVTDLAEDSFFADLQDLSDPKLPIEVVELPLTEVSEDDVPLLQEGAVFYWSIGYESTTGGQLRRISEIRFRRTLRWTKSAIQQMKKSAEELFELYGG